MAVRPDVSIAWYLSPRIITIAAPSTSITIQDLHDTVTYLESRQANLIYDRVIQTAGKEALGGGVLVGLTSTLLDAKVSFEARKIMESFGVVSTADVTGTTLISSTSDFVSDGVEPGSWIVNITDGSSCSVLKVINSTTLLTNGLAGGLNDQFSSSDFCQIWKVYQCDINGGNLVALDGVGSSISPVLSTFGTQVVRTSSSSATLQELQDLQYSSFNGGVSINTSSIYSNTTYPVGTPRQPVNNLTSAQTIANERGFDTFYVIGDLIVDSGGDYTDKTFIGTSKTKTIITISSASNVKNCEFSEATIAGTLDGGVQIKNCLIGDLSYIDGYIEDCVLGLGTITLSDMNTAHFLNCWSGIPGVATPIIDMGGSGSLAMRNYNGGIQLTNKTGPQSVSIDFNSGHILLGPTIVSGTIILRGVGHLTNSGSTANILDTYLTNPESIAAVIKPAIWPLYSKL